MKIKTDHTLHTRDHDLEITIVWQSYEYDPYYLKFIEVEIPDELETRREEVEQLIQDHVVRLKEEALNQTKFRGEPK